MFVEGRVCFYSPRWRNEENISRLVAFSGVGEGVNKGPEVGKHRDAYKMAGALI